MNRIKEVAESEGITQIEIAHKLNKSKSLISMYMNNRVQPNLATLFQIAKILAVDPRDLISTKK